MAKITKEAALEYARGYFETNEEVERFGIKSCKPVNVDGGAIQVNLWVDWKDGIFDAIEMFVFMEDGQPYGEW